MWSLLGPEPLFPFQVSVLNTWPLPFMYFCYFLWTTVTFKLFAVPRALKSSSQGPLSLFSSFGLFLTVLFFAKIDRAPSTGAPGAGPRPLAGGPPSLTCFCPVMWIDLLSFYKLHPRSSASPARILCFQFLLTLSI